MNSWKYLLFEIYCIFIIIFGGRLSEKKNKNKKKLDTVKFNSKIDLKRIECDFFFSSCLLQISVAVFNGFS